VPKKDTSENQEKIGKKGKSEKNKLLLVLVVILAILAGSSAGAYFFLRTFGEAPGLKAAKAVATESLEMGDMVVNLTGSGGGSYLRVKITLEYPSNKNLTEELKKKKPQLTEVIITTLRSKSLAEVSSLGSIQALKDVLLQEINSYLDAGKVTVIYFTDFLVQ